MAIELWFFPLIVGVDVLGVQDNYFQLGVPVVPRAAVQPRAHLRHAKIPPCGVPLTMCTAKISNEDTQQRLCCHFADAIAIINLPYGTRVQHHEVHTRLFLETTTVYLAICETMTCAQNGYCVQCVFSGCHTSDACVYPAK